MISQKKYEVIVIGAGPAGATAGKILADAGKRCLIIDKAVFPRDKLCGGGLTEKTMKLIQEIHGTVDISNFIDSSYATYGLNGAVGERICEYVHPDKKFYFIDRIIFDDFLFQKAKDSGCDGITGDGVEQVDKQGEEFIITLNSGQKVRSNLLIGADGANSVVRRIFNFPTNPKDCIIAVETEINYEDFSFYNNRKIFPEIFLRVLPYGYGWVFPKKDKIVVGIGGLARKNQYNLKEVFIKFISKLTPHNLPALEIKDFPVPGHNFVKTPAKDGVLLVGDAAGFVEPLTGEGIYFAIKSGQLAAQAVINNSDVIKTYNRSAYCNIIKFLKQGRLVKKFFFREPILSYELRKLKNKDKYVKYYFELLSGAIDYRTYFKKVFFTRN